MSQLLNKTRNTSLAEKITHARSVWSRMKGLLGRTSFPQGEAIWLHNCRDVHTWFMKFPIDVIFVDRNFVVCALHKNVKPWRLILPVWKAQSVFELAGGSLGNKVEVGDQLHVAH